MKFRMYNEDCLNILKKMRAESVDLVVTSPPYDNLRTYGGLSWNFEGISAELARVLKPGGVIVWVVADQTVDGSETGTSFRQALHFMSLGLRLHDTMIYQKNNYKPLTHNRYEQCFEYSFIFTKGAPVTFNPIKDKPNKRAGDVVHGTWRDVDGSTKPHSANGKQKVVAEFGMRPNIWAYNSQGKAGTKHPATFPLQLAVDHIISWSAPDAIVLDPFTGSGTTGEACAKTGRRFVGIEVNSEYFKYAEARVAAAFSSPVPQEAA